MKGKMRWKRWGSLLCLFCLIYVCSGCSGFLHPVRNEQSLITKEGELDTEEPDKTETGEISEGEEVPGEKGDAASGSSTKDRESYGTEEKRIYVHVCGCVKNPGLYTFAAGTRAGNAVESAGGFTKKADASAVNLAAVLEDGMQLYVPSKEETASSGGEAGNLVPGGQAGSDSRGHVSSGGVFPEAGESAREEAPVNINTAGAEELMTLSGIGESRAEAILSYREENGAFSSIDDIKNVSGIGEGIFEKIKNMITV